MLNCINELLTTNDYERKENIADGVLFGDDSEFFITIDYSESEFFNFFESERTDNLISNFQDKEEKIKKNTSLFLLVKVDSLESVYREQQNLIMRIEEDEYYFRKYVILYTEEGLNKLRSKITKEELVEIISSAEQFEKFEENMFFDEAYFIAMQLVIKLPFVALPHENKHFKSIESIINNRINSEGLEASVEKTEQLLKLFVSESKSDVCNQILENDDLLNRINRILEG